MFLDSVKNAQRQENSVPGAEFSATDACWQMGSVALEIVMSGRPLSNKEVMAALIKRLEREDDARTQDTCRQLLEYVVYQTPGKR